MVEFTKPEVYLHKILLLYIFYHAKWNKSNIVLLSKSTSLIIRF